MQNLMVGGTVMMALGFVTLVVAMIMFFENPTKWLLALGGAMFFIGFAMFMTSTTTPPYA